MCLVYTAIWQRAASFTPPNQSALAWVTTLTYDLVGSSPQVAGDAHRR